MKGTPLETMYQLGKNSDSLQLGNAAGTQIMMPNYALERSVKELSERAAGAQKIVAPAARRPRTARPAQRGR